MKFTTRLLALFFIVVTSAVGASEENPLLQKLTERLEFHQSVEGNFRQEKYLHFMQRPMVSTGTFSMSRRNGLRWQVAEPVASLMTVQGHAVMLDGSPVKDQGVGQLMAMIMLGFMDGDLAGLARSFSVSGDISADHWQLSLIPDTLLLRSVLNGIELGGDRYLTQIEVIEKSMTRTRISFSDVREVQAKEDVGVELH
jgi:outer membrane lipoprotein-sorting protein